ncbi:MAG: ABC transporter substrate-binding protein, partial [Pseudomonadota bacterium]
MRSKHALEIICAGVFTLLVILSGESKAAEALEAPVPIRIGWQIPAAGSAIITEVLKRTDVLARHGLDPSLVPFSYGTPEVEAALAGKLDAFFAGDQPVINLIARGGKWKIVARINYGRMVYIVPPKSPIKKINDLRGKTVASPFGSTAHREAILEQQAAGLDPDKDVKNVDLDILEIRRRVLAGGIETWEDIDAAVIWDPNVSSFELEGLARSLTETRTLSVVAISDEFIAKHPEAAVQFLVALVRAWDFFSRHPDRVMRWYIDDTQLDYKPETLMTAVGIDPNFGAKSLHDISLELNAEHLAILQKNAAWGVEAWKDGSQIRQFVDQGLLDKAMQQVAAAQFEDIRVILPSIRAVESGKAKEGYGLDS